MANAIPWEVPMQARPGHGDLAETCGDGWWSILHAAMSGIPCPPCREHGEALFSALHDLVNVSLGKPLHDRENFLRVAHEYEVALERLSRGKMGQRLARCTPAKAAKVESCVEELKGDSKVNPWSVCSVSIGCSPWRVPPEVETFDLEGETVVTVEDRQMAKELVLHER